MSDIKQVIRLLCKHLNFLFDVDVKPEHFRLAKFNKTDDNVTQVLWNLLNKLAINSSDANRNLKSYLKNMEYTNSDFYKLPTEDPAAFLAASSSAPQNVSIISSRELLITVCFLLCKNLNGAIIDEIKRSPFHADFQLIHHNNRTPDQTSSSPEAGKFKNQDDRTQFEDWIEHKTVLNRRMTRDYEEQNEKLLRKLLAECPVDEKNLSINEMLALNSEKYCRIFLDKSSRVLQILANHKSWLAKEALFWQWMETVLLEKKKGSLL